MNQEWLTQNQDMNIAREIINQYGGDDSLLGIFEVEMDPEGKILNVKLSEWVVVLTQYFRKRYGEDSGDSVMKRVMSLCMINDQTIHRCFRRNDGLILIKQVMI